MITIEPFKYKGIIIIPASKSYLQRAIAIASLVKGSTVIDNFSPSNDVQAAVSIVREMGAKVNLLENELTITNGPVSADKVRIHCGEAGLSARMFAPIAASLFDQVELQGEGSLLLRPMDMLIDSLKELGIKVVSNDNKLPLFTAGKIQPGEITIDGSQSSQVLTGVLIALAFQPESSIVHVRNLKSKPYVQMTLDLLEHFGVAIVNHNFEAFHVSAFKGQDKHSFSYTAEGDWSGAAFHAVGAAISGEVTLEGLNMQSTQADLKIVDVLKRVGAEIIELPNNRVKIKKKQLKGFAVDATDCPDLFPPLAALASCCEGKSVINGVHRLLFKESNRAVAIQDELIKLGVNVQVEGDTMVIEGGPIMKGVIDSHNDHRIAMMGAILATVADGPISIENHEAVNKSYPLFFEDLPS